MQQILLCLAALAILSGHPVSLTAEEGDMPSQRPCCPPRCPNCKAVWKFEWETAKDTKSCWCIERKAIVIPTITFPWQKCSEPKQARIKWVNRLKEMEYECARCKCKWTVEELPCEHCGTGDAAKSK